MTPSRRWASYWPSTKQSCQSVTTTWEGKPTYFIILTWVIPSHYVKHSVNNPSITRRPLMNRLKKWWHKGPSNLPGQRGVRKLSLSSRMLATYYSNSLCGLLLSESHHHLKHAYPIPCISKCLDALGGWQFYSTIDLRSGYFQIFLNSTDAEKVWPDNYDRVTVME